MITTAEASPFLWYECNSSPTYPGCGTPTTWVNVRYGPGTGYGVATSIAPNSGPSSGSYGFCQELGENVGGNYIWDVIGLDANGYQKLYVSDYYMNTPTYGTTRMWPCSWAP